MGVHVKTRIGKKSQTNKELKNTVDAVYVLYVLSTGLIDDLPECLKTLDQPEWRYLPLQVQVISLAPKHISVADMDSQKLPEEFIRHNREVGWP